MFTNSLKTLKTILILKMQNYNLKCIIPNEEVKLIFKFVFSMVKNQILNIFMQIFSPDRL